MKNSDLLLIRPPVETKILQELNSAGSDLGDYLISKMKHLTKTSDLTKFWKKKLKISSVGKWNFNNNRSEPVKYPVTWRKIYICVFTSKNGFWLKIQLLKFSKFRPRSRICQLRNQKVTFSLNKNKFQQVSSGSPKIMVDLWLGDTVVYRNRNLKILKYDFDNPDKWKVKAGWKINSDRKYFRFKRTELILD